MKRFILLHVGFETPTPQIMQAWGAWFEAVAARTVENAGLRSGREISKTGTKPLPMGPDAITGYTIIEAESLEDAEAIARSNPFITSVRVYEIAAH
jgi:uncharacterized protein YciI